MNLKCLKLVTFDATNTLLKFRVPPWQYYAIVAREHGFQGTDNDIKNCLLDSYKVMLKKYPNFGRTTISWENWWTQIVKMTFKGHLPVNANVDSIAVKLIDEFKTTKCWCKAEGSERLINLLQNSGVCLGVISNFDPRLHEILHNIKLDKVFQFVVTSYESGISKPSKEIFEYAIKKSGKKLKPSECLHIGDDLEKDYVGARNAGWHAVIVSGNVKTENPPAMDHVFKNLDELNLAIKKKTLKL
ncbi:rhythmically expressed gene 2 protein-like [Epargyreus clarus]|uniref:rhythmically expressed gene 2 protein-like n=1 Tax=Epargyreus clarus TaxID=520877 RepID=UPI003C2AC42A